MFVYEIWGSDSDQDVDIGLMVCTAMWTCRQIPKSRYSRTLVYITHKSTRRHIPEDQHRHFMFVFYISVVPTLYAHRSKWFTTCWNSSHTKPFRKTIRKTKDKTVDLRTVHNDFPSNRTMHAQHARCLWPTLGPPVETLSTFSVN
jgi:hypothetical protein